MLFNDALNTFYLWLLGIRPIVKDHSASVETYCNCHMGYSDEQQGIFYVQFPTDGIIQATAFVIHWREQDITQWFHHERLI